MQIASDSRGDAAAPGAPPATARECLVSVVMPCLDEAEAVGVCVDKARRALAEMGVEGEVVVVDNGSSDASAAIAVAHGARVIDEPRRGYGSAYLRGFQEARGRYLAMGDADDSYDFAEIGRFLAPLLAGDCDLVMGTRLKGEILPGAMSWSHRWIGNPILSGMLKLFFKTRISDSHCGMRAFTREAYERMGLRTTGMEFASEMVVNALRTELRVREIPITYHPRIGTSKLAGMRDAWRHVRFMLIFSPSYLFLLPGLTLMLLGGLVVLALAGGRRQIFGHPWDFHPLLFGAAAAILGYNLALFDVLAKTFSMGAGFARPGQWLRRFTRAFTLERGLLLGALLFAAGCGLEAKIIADWLRSGQGQLMAVRGVVIGMTAMVVGLETAFASFLMSLMQIERR
jgi:glycosyltransferase involved in cell wall biosynthesis